MRLSICGRAGGRELSFPFGMRARWISPYQSPFRISGIALTKFEPSSFSNMPGFITEKNLYWGMRGAGTRKTTAQEPDSDRQPSHPGGGQFTYLGNVFAIADIREL